MSQLITTPFGFLTTAEEVLADVDLSGRSALVTGGASGIGLRNRARVGSRWRDGHARRARPRGRDSRRR